MLILIGGEMNDYDMGDLVAAIERLGLNGSATGMGALELVAKEIHDLRNTVERLTAHVSDISTTLEEIHIHGVGGV